MKSNHPIDAPSYTSPVLPGPYAHTALGRFDARFLTAPLARRMLLALLALTLLLPSVQMVRKIGQTDDSIWRGERGRSALGRWLLDARALRDGRNPYEPTNWFPTPPLNLLAIVPLTYVPPQAAGAIWCAAKILLVLAALAYVARAAGPGGRPLPAGVLLMAGLFSFRPVVGDLQHGNLNLFVLAELALFWGLLLRGRDVAAGVALGLAITTKITPLLLLAWIIYKRSWRVAAGTAIGLLLFVIVIPGLLLGFERNARFLQSWHELMVAPYAVHGYLSNEIANQSLPAAMMRWAAHVGWLTVEDMPSEMVQQTGMEHMARAATTAGRLYLRIGGALIVLLLAWWCRGRLARPATSAGRGSSPRHDARPALEFALVLLAMLLISERTWKHHAVTLVLVYLSIWRGLACEAWSNRFTVLCVIGLVAQWFMLIGSGEGVFGDEFADLLLYNGVFCLGLLLCFIQTGAMVSLMRRKESLN